MSILLQGITFSVDFFVLAIEGPDVVLGFPWLQFLGKVAHDYSALTTEYTWQGVPVTLVSDPSLATNVVSLHKLQALVQSEDIASMFTLTNSPTEPELSGILDPVFPSYLPAPVLALLHRFSQVFSTPTGLPPHRPVDHRIHLVEGTKPINVRPYRYPRFQKAEMEKLIREMLDQGIIILSHSPFFSPCYP
ncbi:hypothetical protein KIW84_010200 [Lathyrus oleraceus]|uniref:Uncharacterized protein n=1 Tax=Pisum sativum TaxID=3888 RepID=A0A9D4YLK6_PEA|nr:hypothetical protein KIW84_010200 [Pisum sativum]